MAHEPSIADAAALDRQLPGAQLVENVALLPVSHELAVDEDAEGLPAFSLLWQEEVTDGTLLEAVLTADPDEPF